MNFINNLTYPTISTKSFFLASIFLSIFIGTILPLFVSLETWLPKLYTLLVSEKNLIIYIPIGLYIINYLIIYFYRNTLSTRKFYILLSLLFLLFLGIKIIYVFHYDQNFYSDFRTMWEYAKLTYNLKEFIPPTIPQESRPLVSLVPLVMIFGTSIAVFKILNIIFILFSGLIVSYFTFKNISKHSAILVFIIIMLVPEIYFTSLVPSHDIAGVFYLLLYLLVLYYIIQNISTSSILKLSLLTLLLSFIGLLFDIQRGLLSILIITLIIIFLMYCILNYKRLLNKKYVFILFTVIITPFFLGKETQVFLQKQAILPNLENHMYSYSWAYSHPHTFSNGTYAHSEEFWSNYGSKLLENDLKSLRFMTKSLMLSDLYYNIRERPSNYLMRSKRLYSLGTQGRHFFGQLNNVSKYKQRQINKLNFKWNTIFVNIYIILLFISSIYFIFSKHKKSKNIVYFPLIFMSIISMALLLIGENQPRYLFTGWFFWSIVIAWAIDNFFNKKNTNINFETNISLWNRKGLVAVIIILLVAYIIFKIVLGYSSYKLIDMRTWEKPKCNKEIKYGFCKQAILSFKNSLDDKEYSTLKLRLPRYPHYGDYVKVSKTITIANDQNYTFSTYVMSSYMKKNEKNGFSNINIYINNILEKKLHISNDNKYKFITIKNIRAKNNKIKITVEIKSNIDYNVESLQKEALVNFKFMSLRK